MLIIQTIIFEKSEKEKTFVIWEDWDGQTSWQREFVVGEQDYICSPHLSSSLAYVGHPLGSQ